MRDFRSWSHAQLASLLARKSPEFDDIATNNLSDAYLLEEVAAGRAVFEVDEQAVAVVRPEGWHPDQPASSLWLVYVEPGARRAGHGRALVKRVIVKHVKDYPMVLLCHGEARVRFFRRCGFALDHTTAAGSWMVRMPRKPRRVARPASRPA